jgi:hypothetical protein
VLAADRPELFVRNQEHITAAVYVVNLEQLRPLAALTRSNVDRAAIAIAGEDARPLLAPFPRRA